MQIQNLIATLKVAGKGKQHPLPRLTAYPHTFVCSNNQSEDSSLFENPI